MSTPRMCIRWAAIASRASTGSRASSASRIALCSTVVRSRTRRHRGADRPPSEREIRDAVEQRQHHRAARGDVDRPVELDVGEAERRRLADEPVHPPERVAQVVEFVLRDARRCTLGDRWFQEKPDLEELFDRRVLQVDREHQRVADGRLAHDERPGAVPRLEHAHDHEPADGLAQRRARDAEAGGERALRRQLVPRLQRAGADQLLRGAPPRRGRATCGRVPGRRPPWAEPRPEPLEAVENWLYQFP